MGWLHAAAVSVGSSSVAIATPPAVDRQLWGELDATHPIAADWSATVIFTARAGDDLPNPALTAGGLQIDYRSGSLTATGTGYYVSIRNAVSALEMAIWLPAAAPIYTYGVPDRLNVVGLTLQFDIKW